MCIPIIKHWIDQDLLAYSWSPLELDVVSKRRRDASSSRVSHDGDALRVHAELSSVVMEVLQPCIPLQCGQRTRSSTLGCCSDARFSERGLLLLDHWEDDICREERRIGCTHMSVT